MPILTSSVYDGILYEALLYNDMITSIRIKNFRSIVEIDIPLLYDEGKAPNGYKSLPTWPFLSDDTNVRAVPCLALFGANASGKSNIISAIIAMRELFVDGSLLQEPTRESEYFQPNKIQQGSDTSTFGLGFTVYGSVGSYKVVFSKNAIVEEELILDDDVLISANKGQVDLHPRLFKDDYDERKLKSIYEVECCSLENESAIQNTLLLHVLARNYSGLNLLLTASLLSIAFLFPLPVSGIADLSKYRDEHFEQVKQLLKQFDFDIVDIVKHEHGIKTYHLNDKKEKVEFDLSEESLGTQILLKILHQVSRALDIGTALIIDEIDRSLHPLLLIEIIRLFKSKEYNKRNAQLIFTTHTTDILDADNLLRVSEVGIVTKTKKSGTKIHRLSENKELRNVKNFRKSYLEGAFRGIPYPYFLDSRINMTMMVVLPRARNKFLVEC